MNLTDFTLNSIKEFISGDCELTPYLSGPKIIKLFNEVGIRDIYDGGMPENESRNAYVYKKLKEINGTKNIITLIELVFDPRHFAQDESLIISQAVEKINPLLTQDGYRIEEFEGKYKIVGADLPEEIEVEIHFEDIQNQIVEQIRSAKFTIWVAVAWFTDKVLMQELYNRSKDGLNIRLVVFDDDINNQYGFKYENVFETKRVKPSGIYKNIMHHKFCIIDFKTVIHGSYNWTNKARWNKETISIDYGKEIAEKFGNEFITLIK
ncbi:phospholipase D-like domain-containing protein [Aestuariibaculum lutulentum]|uniref:phospholipase D n=1 Tax=Aestuariibaculum lutulentum TaxID=2920935 RepID=A0ABS9RMF0_9FLAO|nr:phospholipase D-like domain-containing protein [Aestuariibaculum lutulentum]MCH4554129.1 phospholipase D-like domain-containing protein [Aestuariibaculum lutulentum]